jgi:hypothetical protein
LASDATIAKVFPSHPSGVQRESRGLRHPITAGRLPTGRQALQHERLAAPLRAEREAKGDRMPPQFGECAVLIRVRGSTNV